jgi:diadenosine tetraphosphate (Ap4A) HIT family hydrolase
MIDCIFCKIVADEIPSFKIWEDKDFLAFLDINPNTKGTTILATKKHYPSYLFNHLPEKEYLKMMKAVRVVSLLLKETLKVKRTGMVFDGTGMNHAHIKLYPVHGLKTEFGKQKLEPPKVFFRKTAGFITSQIGPQADFEELKKTAEKIRKNA